MASVVFTLQATSPVSEVGRKVIEHQFILKVNKELEMLSKTAEERYLELIDPISNVLTVQRYLLASWYKILSNHKIISEKKMPL